jgi:hypothetical protein
MSQKFISRFSATKTVQCRKPILLGQDQLFTSPASLSIEMEGGEVIQGEKGVFDGFWATPMSWDQVRAKFDRLVDGRIDKGLGAELAAAAQDIDAIGSRDLTALLGRVSRP